MPLTTWGNPNFQGHFLNPQLSLPQRLQRGAHVPSLCTRYIPSCTTALSCGLPLRRRGGVPPSPYYPDYAFTRQGSFNGGLRSFWNRVGDFSALRKPLTLIRRGSLYARAMFPTDISLAEPLRWSAELPGRVVRGGLVCRMFTGEKPPLRVTSAKEEELPCRTRTQPTHMSFLRATGAEA